MKKRLIIFLLALYNIAYSQSIPLDQQVQKRFNEITLAADTSVFTAFRATDWLEYKHFLSPLKTQVADSAFGLNGTPNSGYFIKSTGTNNWIQSNGKNSFFTIDPYFDASGGKSKEQSSLLYEAAAGIRLQGTVNDKLSYSLAYVYTSERFPNYLNTYFQNNQSYGLGMGKGTPGSNGAYGFSQFTGHITYMPTSHFLISAGNGKNFIGDGYRSLILSDNASNYPFIRLQARYWKFTYNVIYAKMDNPRYLVNGSNQQKYSVMHLLGINFSKRFQLGFYENEIFYAKDTTIHRGFDVQYLSPLIFMRPLEFSIGSPDNAFMGFTGKYILNKKGFIYGQIGLDDLHISESFKNHGQHFGNKYALQLGIFNRDVFKIPGLAWRLEWNAVRPYMYGHGFDKPGINYTHDNQSLADPFNANFHEFISIFQYNKERWYGSLENLLTIRGEQPADLWYPNGENLWGGDPNLPKPGTNEKPPTYGSKTLQGIKNYYYYNQLTAGYLVNPKNRLAIEATAVYRHHKAPGVAESDVYFMIGIKTNLFNRYKDF
jgi:hypothetical protein